ncbi:MAG: hypothetical protein AAF682_19585 [Planctomycetota bacterium]
MPYTQAQLTALEDALALGAVRVKYEDRDVTYRSVAEMEALRGRMRRELGLASVGQRRRYAQFSKGLGPTGTSDAGCP